MNGVLEQTTQDHAFAVLQALDRYNGWIASQFRDAPPGRLLEVGAGIGNLTRWFLDARSILAIDVDPSYLDQLRQKYGARPGFEAQLMDITASGDRLGSREFDSIIMVNVLEHIEDDLGTLRLLARHLSPGGKLHILVPAHPFLYGEVDRRAGHARRYRDVELRSKLEQAGLRVSKLRHFNMLGAIGWWFNIKLLRRKYLPERQSRILDRLVPILALEERIHPPFGLSLIASAERP